MKLMLLLCGAAILTAGCNSTRNPYGYQKEFSYNYDLVPQPLPGITPSELDQIEQAQIVSPPISLYRNFASEHNDTR